MAKLADIESIGSYFKSLSDPRHARNRKHLLVDIIVIVIGGMLCGSNGPTASHRCAASRLVWLQELLALPNGIPSRDCIRRLLMAFIPEAFQRCSQQRMTEALQADDSGRLRPVAIDGKTCIRSMRQSTHSRQNRLGCGRPLRFRAAS